jgi:hypothetical protein
MYSGKKLICMGEEDMIARRFSSVIRDFWSAHGALLLELSANKEENAYSTNNSSSGPDPSRPRQQSWSSEALALASLHK